MFGSYFKVVPWAFLVAVALVLAGRPVISQEKQSPFKNVQVWTDLTQEQLEDYMATVVDYLGVKKCTYCHVRDKGSDENPHKVEARKYMKMTKELNETVFKESKEKITCYTCHRGEEHPLNHPKE